MKIKKVLTQLHQGSRPIQEDAFLSQPERGLFVVADGFGGSGPGVEASKLACESVARFLEKEARDRDATLPFTLKSYYSLAGNVLLNSIIFANEKIRSHFKGKTSNARGGASVTAAFLDEDTLAFANFGSCRVDLIRRGEWKELVTPRSYARLLDPTGGSDSKAGFQFPLVALGLLEEIEPEVFEMRVEAGDWVILRTDGLDNLLHSQEHWKHFYERQELPQSTDDNAALIAIQFG